MLGMSASALRATMSHLGGLASFGLQRQSTLPTYIPQTSLGMAAQFDTLYHQLATQLQKAKDEAQPPSDDTGDADTDGTNGSTVHGPTGSHPAVTVIQGQTIPTEDINVFNQMVQEGYIESLSRLLAAMESDRLDDNVYQAFLSKVRRDQEGHLTLKRDSDGAEQWQVSGRSIDGPFRRPLEKRRYDPDDRDSLIQLLTHVR